MESNEDVPEEVTFELGVNYAKTGWEHLNPRGQHIQYLVIKKTVTYLKTQRKSEVAVVQSRNARSQGGKTEEEGRGLII